MLGGLSPGFLSPDSAPAVHSSRKKAESKNNALGIYGGCEQDKILFFFYPVSEIRLNQRLFSRPTGLTSEYNAFLQSCLSC